MQFLNSHLKLSWHIQAQPPKEMVLPAPSFTSPVFPAFPFPMVLPALCYHELGRDVDSKLFYFLHLKATVKLQHYMLHQKSHQILTNSLYTEGSAAASFLLKQLPEPSCKLQIDPCFPLLVLASQLLVIYT